MSDDRPRTQRGDTYASRIPYVVPASLDDLTGPATGVVRLPAHLDWSPDPSYDLDDPSDRVWLYTRVIREAADTDDLTRHLAKTVLLEVWPKLPLPARCAELWQTAFPELGRS